jgi:hypothetical protein
VERFSLVRENRALIRRLEASNRLLRSVQEMGTSLSGETYLDRLLTRLVAAAKELSGAEAGRAMLFRRTHDLQGLTIEIAAGDGATPSGAPPGIAVRDGPARNPRRRGSVGHPRYSTVATRCH